MTKILTDKELIPKTLTDKELIQVLGNILDACIAVWGKKESATINQSNQRR